MASNKTLNAKNLEALGAARLAELLIEVSIGNAAAKRRVRLELAGAQSPGEVVICTIPNKPVILLPTGPTPPRRVLNNRDPMCWSGKRLQIAFKSTRFPPASRRCPVLRPDHLDPLLDQIGHCTCHGMDSFRYLI